MNIFERKTKILDALEKKTSITVHELADLLNVSGVTVRKLLTEMDQEGLLKRTRGGAVSLKMIIKEAPQLEKERKNTAEKRAVAFKAHTLIQPGSTVYLDAGSTSMELARVLAKKPIPALTVVTNAINVAYELLGTESIEIIVIGGYVRHSIMSCVGSTAEDMIDQLCFDYAFIGCNGLHVETGATTPNLTEAEVKKEVIKNSFKKILICDSSKYGLTSMAKICPADAFQAIITDWQLSQESQKELTAAGVELMIADEIYK